MPEVSVLVAVYNAADTLARCLDSLLNQTLPDVQIICIDDAS
ncbi:MAG: glycosyltransferase, partial [Bacteroidaceae bacterium]|nr:glycosyltransferase [Bacteroidaceae bacterium]